MSVTNGGSNFVNVIDSTAKIFRDSEAGRGSREVRKRVIIRKRRRGIVKEVGKGTIRGRRQRICAMNRGDMINKDGFISG